MARALLDPSDANIAAMMRRLQRDQAIAAYVGQRMTELSQADPSLVVASGAVPSDLPSFAGLRLVLVTRPDCAAPTGWRRCALWIFFPIRRISSA